MDNNKNKAVGLWKSLSAFILGMRLSKFFFLLATISWGKCFLLFFLVAMLVPSYQRPGYYPDSLMYETMANNLLAGAGLSLSTAPPYQPTMAKEPLYPTVIALFKAVFGDNIDGLVLLQILVNPLIAILVYLIGNRLFDGKVARLSALLVALIPIYGDISFSVMPESFFVVLFLSTILLLLAVENTASPRGFLLAGALLGLSSLFKNVVLPLAVLYPAVLILKHRESLNRRMAMNVILFLLSFSLVTTPWMLRNKHQLGLFSISVRGGSYFSHQASWAAHFTMEEWKAYSLYLLSGRLAQKLYPQVIGSDLGEYEYAVLMRYAYVGRLQQKHKEGEVERILVQEGIQNVLRHPLKFLALSLLVELQTLKYFVPGSLMFLKGPAGAEWLFPSTRFLLLLMGILFTFLTVRGMLYCKGRLSSCSLILVTVAYFHIASASLGVVPNAIQRYILPVTVFYSFFIVIALLGRSWEEKGRAEGSNLTDFCSPRTIGSAHASAIHPARNSVHGMEVSSFIG